jgi:polyhydroxyalkanoate synthase
MPLLNIYGKYDHLVPPESCEKLTSAVGSKDTEDICLRTGHIGIYVSSKCQQEFAPKIAQWLGERDTPSTPKATVLRGKTKPTRASAPKAGARRKKTDASGAPTPIS